MEELSFLEKVNQSFEKGWKSNEEYDKALKDLNKVLETQRQKQELKQEIASTLKVDEIVVDSKTPTIEKDDDAR